MSLLSFLAAAPLAAAAWADLRHRLIPDWTVAALLALGLAAAVLSGAPGPAVAGATLGAIAGAGLALAGVWGWGDAKLLAAAGALAGLAGLPALLLGTSLAGGGLAAILLLLRAPARRWMPSAGAPRWLTAEARRLRRAPSVPYGLAIVAGTLFALLTQGLHP